MHPLRRQHHLTALIRVLDAAAAGTFMHRLADLRFRPAHEALAVCEIFATRVQAAVNYVHSVPVDLSGDRRAFSARLLDTHIPLDEPPDLSFRVTTGRHAFD